MKCPECDDLLQRRLDGEAVLDPALEQHLADCAGCRDRQTAAVRLLDGLRLAKSPMPPARLADRLVGARLADRRWPLRWRRWMVRAAAAAALLAAVAVGWHIVNLDSDDQDGRDGRVANNDPKKQPPTKPDQPTKKPDNANGG